MIAGVTCVRNEIDVIDFVLYHHLNQGIDLILIADNGSTDGTFEFLTKLSQEDKRIKLYNFPGEFQQQEIITELSRDAHSFGCEWIIPFDADEIWLSEKGLARDLESVNKDHTSILIRVENFVQEGTREKTNIYSNVSYRVPLYDRPFPEEFLVEETDIIEGKRSLVEFEWGEKNIIKTSYDLVVTAGSHSYSSNLVRREKIDKRFRICQVPLRSYLNIIRKAEHGQRLIDAGHPPMHGWECQRLVGMTEEELKKEWFFNTSEKGILTRPNGTEIELVHDNTIKNIYKKYLRNRRKQ
jgi:glycosyltransferase involved in cell wall biosynthesis